ncbi:uncharacterized protein LOC115634153 [Scaptodrosophila lebanonensis]|uniref:Uncharacterized protein LOC115634153 n=1 Tax=Drosophila lebanonensis TaxID=7225 RepID=A0A6J2UJB4_DROLE|nr:uncharacterized protein LOC115634153 [Scaptodrosophila lebanonensis]
MNASLLIVSCVLLAVMSIPKIVLSQTIDCRKPPQLVDPARCCQDGGRDQVTEKCAQRVGINGQSNGGPPTLEAATCLAQCILTDSRYLQQPQSLNLKIIREDLTKKYFNDTAYVEAMVTAFAKCEPQAQQKLVALQQLQFGSAASQFSQNQQQPQCSPFSAMLLGCTYMEYFKNCPSHRWTENNDCALAKAFVTQCALGA